MAYSQGQMVALGFIFMILPLIFVGLRVWARRISGMGMSWDDYTIFAALVPSCILQVD